MARMLSALLLVAMETASASARGKTVHVHVAAAPATSPSVSSNAVATTTNSSLVCGAPYKRNPHQLILSLECPSVCGAPGICVYYPPAAKGNCVERPGLSACYDGDICTFECLSPWGSMNSWYITVFDNDATFAKLDATNAPLPVRSVFVNASAVSKLDALDKPSAISQLYVTRISVLFGASYALDLTVVTASPLATHQLAIG